MVLPVGQGSLALGAHLGFERLARAGLIERMPVLTCVQAEACAPLVRAWEAGLEEVPPVEVGETAAEGIRIRAPLRGRALLAALRSTGGRAVAVKEGEIAEAHALLARRGLYVEPTSAAAAAGLGRVAADLPEGPVVLVLTGSGLKTPVKG
jgi:threonine synthase